MTSMRVVAVAGVEEALNLIKDSITSDEEQKKYTHWSQHCLVAGAIVCVIATIAAAVLGQYHLVVLGAALCAVDLVGAYYIKQFIPLKSIDGYVSVLSQQNKEISEATEVLSKIQVKISAIIDQISALQRIDVKLNTTLKETFTEHEKTVQEAIANIKESKANVNTLTSLQSSLNEVEQNLASNIEKANASIQSFDEHEDLLRKDADLIKRAASQLTSSISTLDHKIETLESENDALKELLEKLKQEITLWKHAHSFALSKQKELQDEVEKLKSTMVKIETSAKLITAVKLELEQARIDYRKTITELAQRNRELTQALDEQKKQPIVKKQ